MLLVLLGSAVLMTGVACGKGDSGKRTDVPLVTSDSATDKSPRKTKTVEAGIPDPTAPKR
jgi:hypothetical protein